MFARRGKGHPATRPGQPGREAHASDLLARVSSAAQALGSPAELAIALRMLCAGWESEAARLDAEAGENEKERPELRLMAGMLRMCASELGAVLSGAQDGDAAARGDVAVAILKAIMRGGDYPPAGVGDTPENRRLWEQTRREVASLPPGAVVDIPSDWAAQ